MDYSPRRRPRCLATRTSTCNFVGAQPALTDSRTHRTMKHPLTALASLVAVLAGATAAPQEAANTTSAVKEVMDTMTIPASDAIFAAASEPPKDAAQWV